MAFHSKFNNETKVACGIPLCPIKTTLKGPAEQVMEDDIEDIIDEAIQLYRPNILFKNYDIEGPGDVFMIYMMVWISNIVRKIENEKTQKGALEIVKNICKDPVPKPQDGGFFMKGLLKDPKNASELDKYQGYIKQAREELTLRLLDILYYNDQQSFDFKFWVGLAKNNFMNLKYSKF